MKRKNKDETEHDITEEESITSGSEYNPSCLSSTSESEMSDGNLSEISSSKEVVTQACKKLNLSSDSSLKATDDEADKVTLSPSINNSSEFESVNEEDLLITTKVGNKRDAQSTAVEKGDYTTNKQKIKKRKLSKTSAEEKTLLNNNSLDSSLDLSNEVGNKRDAQSTDVEKGDYTINQQKAKKRKLSKTSAENKTSLNNISLNSSLDLSIILKGVGEVIKNKDHLFVPSSKDGIKKNVCLYCIQKSLKEKNPKIKMHYANLVDHLEKAHKEDKYVIMLSKIEKKPVVKGQKRPEELQQRIKILDYLRNKANYLNNLNASDISKYVVSRRPTQSESNTVAKYGTCFKCYKQLSLSSIHKHVRKCAGMSFSKRHLVKSSSKAVMGAYHESASDDAIEIISHVRDDDTLEEIRYDKVAFLWLNVEASKYAKAKHNHDKVRVGIRRLGRLLREMKLLNENINELADLFHEENYEQFIEAVKIMGKLDPVTKHMAAPGTASDMFYLIKSVSSLYDVMLGEKQKEKRLEVQAFEKKLIRLWHSSIGNTIAEQQAENRRNKDVDLPNTEDIKCIRKYFEINIPIAVQDLKKNYSDNAYSNLRDMLGCYLQVVNCRRPGEVQRFKINEFRSTKIQGNNCRAEVRGKRTKPVPIVFHKNIHKALVFLISETNRKKAKISMNNPFVFANVNDVDEKFSCVKLNSAMAKFADLCGAEKPSTLRGTGYRKQVATDRAVKGIDNKGLEDLSSFLGHTPKIHCQNYRQSVFERDIAVANLVQESQTGESSNKAAIEKNKSISKQLNLSCEQDYNDTSFQNSLTDHEKSESAEVNDFSSQNTHLGDDQNNNSTIDEDSNSESKHKEKDQSGRQIRNKSHLKSQHSKTNEPCIVSKKLPWKQHSIDTLLAYFPNCLNLNHKVPSAAAIKKFISETDDKILSQRTEPQIRSWIHIQRKGKKGDSDVPQRNNIPNYIYSSFKSYIEAGKEPSNKTCAKFLSKSPSKANITINNIQNWVKLAIRRKSC